MKSVLILTKHFPPTNIVGAFRPFRLVRHLEQEGVVCNVVTCFPTQGTVLDTHRLKQLTSLTSISYIYKKHHPSRSGKGTAALGSLLNKKCSSPHRFPMIRRLRGAVKDMLRKWIRPDIDILHVPGYILKAIKISRREAPEVLVTTSPPHSIHIAGMILAKWCNIPWVVDLRDPWDSLTTRNAISHHYDRELKSRFSHRLKHHIINQADAVISSTRTYSRILINQSYTKDIKKFHTVTNCYETKLAAAEKKKIPDRFIISYVGIFYAEKDPYVFFRALRTWIDGAESERKRFIVSRLRIQLIGSGDVHTRRQITNLHLDKIVRFIDRVPHDEAIRLLRGSDMALISTGFSHRTRPGWLPSKLFEYLGCQIPILALTPEGEASEIIRQTNSGYVITSEDHAAVGRILDIELAKKFDVDTISHRDFTFSGIDQFEERNVMAQMVSIVQSVAKSDRRSQTRKRSFITPHMN